MTSKDLKKEPVGLLQENPRGRTPTESTESSIGPTGEIFRMQHNSDVIETLSEKDQDTTETEQSKTSPENQEPTVLDHPQASNASTEGQQLNDITETEQSKTSPENQEAAVHDHSQASEASTDGQQLIDINLPPIIEESPSSVESCQHHKPEPTSQSQVGTELSPAAPIAQRESLTPLSSSYNLSASSSTRLDWTLTLTPKQRSCINLVNIEPCVNKAMGNLESLMDVLSNKLEEDQELQPTSNFHSRRPPSPNRPVSFRLSTLERNRRDSELSVEGVPTGIAIERLRKHALTKRVRIKP